MWAAANSRWVVWWVGLMVGGIVVYRGIVI